MKTKVDKIFFNKSSNDYIPVAYHYDETTLLTKNGELVQTILINGINSEHISNNLVNLRQVVRQAIAENIQTEKFSIWIHTIRKKTNLDDLATYDNFFASNVHDIWAKKNYWRDKFVNTLYITIVYAGVSFKPKNLKELFKNLNFNFIKNTHTDYLIENSAILSTITDNIVNILQEFGAKKLSLVINDNIYYSELLFLYARIIHLREEQVPLANIDLAEVLANHSYAIGSNKIQVIADEDKRFASVISFKEYQEISTEELDKVLQLPVELIASEVFYFINKVEVFEHIKHQNEILNFSNDLELKELLAIDSFITAENNQLYCNQQINITIIDDEIEQLEYNTTRVSKALSALGIMHVREDIGLEQAFWAQLPGNFKYLKRQQPALLSNIASLASLHNSPTGVQMSIWGKFITLFRTEKGTPYFMNFHNKDFVGHTCVFGLTGSGKTTLINFLTSEAMKIEPLITYITDNRAAQLFIQALGGKSIDVKEQISLNNPLLCRNDELGNRYIKNLIDIIFIQAIEDENLNLEKQRLVEFIVNLEEDHKNFKYIYENFKFNTAEQGKLKHILENFLQQENWYAIINASNETVTTTQQAPHIIAYNFHDLTEINFEAAHYPTEAKLKTQYYESLQIVNQVRSMALLGIIYKFINITSVKPRILIIDHFLRLFKFFTPQIIRQIFDDIAAANGIILTTVNIEDRENLNKLAIWREFYSKLATKIILPSNNVLGKLNETFELSEIEFKKLKSLLPLERLFMIKQENTIIVELSLGGVPGILRILSNSDEDIAVVQEIIEQKNNDPEEWLEEVYEYFNKQQ